jgi:ribosomal protein L29
MAKKAELTKESLHTMAPNELQVRLQEAQEQQFRLKFRHASSQANGPLGMEIRKNRRTIARLKTVLHQKKEGKA